MVIPVYRNAETLSMLYNRLRQVLDSLCPYELLFVNDACPANSLEVLQDLALHDERVSILDLERGVGQHQAVMIGLAYARGEQIVIMDADLQDPPEAIPALLSKLEEGFAAVFAGRRGWYESFWRLLTSRVFKWLLHFLCAVPKDAGMFVAINTQLKERLLACHWPIKPFVVAMIGCMKLRAISIPVIRNQRLVGHSAYNFGGRLKSGCRAIAGVMLFKYFPQWRFSASFISRTQVKAYIGKHF
jgi:glycosyltransferase involved in cell wall biosynthesis